MPLVFHGQGILFAALFRHRGLAMPFLEALIAGVGHSLSLKMEPDARLLEHPEVMPPACGVRQTEDRAHCLVHDELHLQREAFFLPRVPVPLFFDGARRAFPLHR